MSSTSIEEPRCAPNTSLQVMESKRLKASPSANTQLSLPALTTAMPVPEDAGNPIPRTKGQFMKFTNKTDSRRTDMIKQVSVLRSFKLLPGTLALLFSLPLFLNAGTITFYDLSDTTTYVDDTGRAPNLICGPEYCYGNLFAPTGDHAQPGGLYVYVREPGTTSVSDTIFRQGSDPSSVQLQFGSDLPPPNPAWGRARHPVPLTWVAA